ncbi:MAG: sec-independent protein translocase protein TatB [Arenicella sp.]|jgi:sec-independent protein translocase protein TatB
MLDIGFFELLVVAVVLIIVMGPERLPEVAQKAAFFIRKVRQGMFRLRSEMQNEIEGTPFADLEKAKQEMADLKNDLRQFGRELVNSTEQKAPDYEAAIEMTGEPITDNSDNKESKTDSAKILNDSSK